MKNAFGKPLEFDRELALLATGYEWYTADEFYNLICTDGDIYRQVAAVEIKDGRKEMFLVRIAERTGYRCPRASSGCRLRTGNPDHGR